MLCCYTLLQCGRPFFSFVIGLKTTPMTRSQFLFVGSGLLLALTFAAYFPVFFNGFVEFDDNIYVIYNSHTAEGLSLSGLQYAFTTFESGNWIPLTWLSFQLDSTLFGMHPVGFHATNLFLHGLNTLLLFFWLVRVTGLNDRSLLVAALFSVHPLHVESVAWIAERKDVLSGFWLFATLFAYERYALKRSLSWYLASLICFACGLLSKSMLVTVPLLLLLVDFWPLNRISRMRHIASISRSYPQQTMSMLLLEKVPFLALSLADGIVTIVVASYSTAFEQTKGLSFVYRIANAVDSYGWYIAKTFWPTDLSVLYPHPMNNVAWESVAISAVILLVVCIYVIFNCRQRPYLLFGWLWFVIAFLPVIGLLQVGSQAHADRYCYIPHIGLFTMLVWEIAERVDQLRISRRIPISISIAIIGYLARLTTLQAGVWETSETLWKNAVNVDPENWFARGSLASLYLESGKLDEATEHFKFVLEIHPEHRPTIEKLVHIYRKYQNQEIDESRFRNELGMFHVRSGQIETACRRFAQAVAVAPEDASARNNLALALAQLGRYGEAEIELERVLSQEPDNTNAHVNLADLLVKKGQLKEARDHYQVALQSNPADKEARDKFNAIERRLSQTR
jgi:protein O-mannosyl-transferase